MLTSELSSDYLEEMDIKFVETKILDPSGRLRSRTFPVKRFDVLKEKGFRVDGSSIGYADVEKSDMEVKLLERAHMILPEYHTAIFLCELYDDGQPVQSFGRNILKNVLEGIPYDVKFGVEIEYYLTTPDRRPLDGALYMESAPGDTAEDFKKEFMLLTERANSDLGIQVSHAEVGPSQHECELTFGNPVDVLDRLILLKYLLRFFAKEKGIRATIMPKPFYEKAGNGMHYHISFWNGDESLFYGTKDEISDIAKYAIGGVLSRVAELAILTNNTVNSYKRLVPHHEAPVWAVWGYENRTAMVRIPKSNGLTPNNTRPEYRFVDGANEHYIAAAGVIKAMQKGIDGKEEYEEFKGNAYQLTPQDIKKLGVPLFPTNLDEAIQFAEKENSLPREIHPDFDRFLNIKRKELKEYREFLGNARRNPGLRITEWELDKYFNL